jgi:hypothetical protein
MNAIDQEPTATPAAAAPVGNAAKRAAKRPSKVKVTKPKAKKAKSKGKSGIKAKGKGPQVLREYVEKGVYKVRDRDTANGNPSIDCGDKVASALRGMTLADVYEHVAKKANLPLSGLKKRFNHLNPGMQRMNLGNVLRGAQ